jgi:hypothetical protein
MNTHSRLYALLFCALALAVLLLGQAPQAQAQDPQLQSLQAALDSWEPPSSSQASLPDTLDMTGDWKLTYGYTLGFTGGTPAGSPRTYIVHFDREGPGSYGVRYKGYYKPGGLPHNPLLEVPGALTAETFNRNRGQFVVQLVEHIAEGDQHYFALLSGYHLPTTEPGKVEIWGGWTDINRYLANFTLVKI